MRAPRQCCLSHPARPELRSQATPPQGGRGRGFAQRGAAGEDESGEGNCGGDGEGRPGPRFLAALGMTGMGGSERREVRGGGGRRRPRGLETLRQ